MNRAKKGSRALASPSHPGPATQRATITAAGMAAALAFSACSSGDASRLLAPSAGSTDANGAERTGTISLALDLGPGTTIDQFQYVLSNGAVTRSGSIDVTNSLRVTATVGGIPQGSGYSITVTGTSLDGSVVCAGTATGITVLARSTTNVTVFLRCEATGPDAGEVLVNGTVDECPVLTAVSILPDTVAIGSTMLLSASAYDPDNGPSPLSYQWAANSGTFTDPTLPNATFTCTEEGTPTLTLTVSDGVNVPGCPAVLSAQVNCTACAADGSLCVNGNTCFASNTCQSGQCVGSNPAPAGIACGTGQVCDANGSCLGLSW